MSLTLTTGGIKLKEGVPISREFNRVSHWADKLHRTKSSRSNTRDLIARQVHTKGICRAFEYLHVSDRGSTSALKTNEANRTNSV